MQGDVLGEYLGALQTRFSFSQRGGPASQALGSGSSQQDIE